MFHYRMYGMKIVSDREIFQLLTEERAKALDEQEGKNSGNLPTVYIKKGVTDEMKNRDKSGARWNIDARDSWVSNLTAWINVLDGEKICYEVKPDGQDSKLNSFLLGFGMAMIALQRGILPVHSSGIMKGNNAILISGESGAGKSTLTAEYLEKGYDLMADDVTFVCKGEEDRPFAYPAFPYQKLCRNEVEKRHAREEGLVYIGEEKDKFLVPWRGNYTAGSRPLRAIVFVAKYTGEDLRIEEIKGIDKYAILSNTVFMLALLGKKVFQKEIGQNVLWLASQIPLVLVMRPEGRDTLDEITKKTMELVEQYFE